MYTHAHDQRFRFIFQVFLKSPPRSQLSRIGFPEKERIDTVQLKILCQTLHVIIQLRLLDITVL